jgi:hypothetical protein
MCFFPGAVEGWGVAKNEFLHIFWTEKNNLVHFVGLVRYLGWNCVSRDLFLLSVFITLSGVQSNFI